MTSGGRFFIASACEPGTERMTGTLTEAERWTPVLKDGRTVGVVILHVETMYPLEIRLAQTLAAGNPVVGVTWIYFIR